MRLTALLACFVLLAACDKGEDKSKSGGSTPPANPPAATPPATPAPDANPPATPGVPAWTGTLEKMGPSIHMQGSHKLTADGRMVVLLKSAKVDLTAWEGKKVVVTGSATQTVEGNQTIVDVETVREAK